MALVLATFKQALIDATEGITDPDVALLAFGNEIANYIVSNAQVSFSWNGINPAIPSTDPVVTASGALSGIVITIAKSGATAQAAALLSLATDIMTGVAAGTYNITDPGFATAPLPLSGAPTAMTGLLGLSLSGDDRPNAMQQLAQAIIDYVIGLVPPAPVLGSHGLFTAPSGVGGTVLAIS